MWYALVAGRCLVGLVFLAAAVGKLPGRVGFGEFAGSIRLPLPLPPGLARPAAGAFVAGEAMVAPLLVAAPLAGFALAGALLLLATAAIGATVHSGRRVPCRCFGAAGATMGYRHLVRNGVLLAVVAGGLTGQAMTTGSAAAAGAMIAAGAGLIGALIFIKFDEVVDLFSGTV